MTNKRNNTATTPKPSSPKTPKHTASISANTRKSPPKKPPSPEYPWQNKTTNYVVLFGTDWCGHCVRFQPEWNLFVKATTEHNKKHRTKAQQIHCKKVNATDSPLSRQMMTKEGVSSYPTILVYCKGKRVGEYDGIRTADALMEYAKHQCCSSDTQRGGGIWGSPAPYPQGSPASGSPFDVPSQVPPGQQASSPTTAMPPAPLNGGLYGGESCLGKPWCSVPVPATSAAYINENLRSANPPKAALTQYPTGAQHRPGNSFTAMPGVSHYAQGGKGPNRILCTGCQGGGGGRKSRRARQRRHSKRRHSKTVGKRSGRRRVQQ